MSFMIIIRTMGTTGIRRQLGQAIAWLALSSIWVGAGNAWPISWNIFSKAGTTKIIITTRIAMATVITAIG